MTDFLHSIFGGSSAQQTAQATSTPTNFTDASLQGLSPDLASSLRTLLGQYGTTGPQYGGQTTAPITGNESSILDTIKSQVAPGNDASTYIKSVLNGNYLPGSSNQNPYLQQAITAAQRPVLDNLTQTLTRDLPGRFTQGGQFIQANTGENGGSSAFDRAAAIATQSAANMSTDIAAKIGSDAYTNERQNQNTAAQLDQTQVQTTINALQAEALPRLIQQYGLDQGTKLFQTSTAALLQLLGQIGQVQSPTLANTSQSTSQGTSNTDKGIVPGLFPKGI